MKEHTGFLPPKKVETKEEGAKHVLGASTVPGRVINPSGDWTPYSPEGERQRREGTETNACTVFNSLNRFEMLLYKANGVRVNYSDRYVANLAVMKGILDPNRGANVHDILELIRKVSGLLDEGRLPWDKNYYTVDQSLMAELMLEGPAWYKDWQFKHAWLWTDPNLPPSRKRELIKDALTKGTVGVSVYAWVQNGLYYKPVGAQDGHWTGIDKVEDTHYVCGDSYEPFIKKLDPLFDFEWGKIYYVTPRPYTFLKNLSYGMTHPDVAELQKALVSLGYEIPHAVTNLFGKETRTALWKFQVAKGIADDGTHFGPRTRYALNLELTQGTGIFGEMVLFIRSILGV